MIEKLYIETTKDERMIRVLLPDDYDSSIKEYGVIYMHDGQNLFNDYEAYGGHSWKIYESKKKLVDLGYEDMIIVGIDNSNLRMFEYSPWKNEFSIGSINIHEIGGMGDIYTNFIIHDVIPMIELKYRVKKDKNHRFLAGSSLGAYISQYIICKYPEFFKGAGIFSLASWFNEDVFLSYVKQSDITQKNMFFISIGKHETSDTSIHHFDEIYLSNSRNLRQLLLSKGINKVSYTETDDQHNEQAWQKQFPYFYAFIQENPLSITTSISNDLTCPFKEIV